MSTPGTIHRPLRVGVGDDRRIDLEKTLLFDELRVPVFTTACGMLNGEDHNIL